MTNMLPVGSRQRLILGLAAIVLAIIVAYFVADSLYEPLAYPIAIGTATAIVVFLVRRWQVKPPPCDSELQKIIAMINLTPLLKGSYLTFSDYAMEPVYLFDLLSRFQTTDIDVIVECGSGTSTLLIGNLLCQKGRGHLYSLEDDFEWYKLMLGQIKLHNLDSTVTLVYAPLEERDFGAGALSKWYSPEILAQALVAVNHIDVLIVDGPKSQTDLARFPALPFFLSRITPHTLIVLDDVNRQAEQLVLSKWQEMENLEVEYRRKAHRHQAYLRLLCRETDRMFENPS